MEADGVGDLALRDHESVRRLSLAAVGVADTDSGNDGGGVYGSRKDILSLAEENSG